MDPNPPEPVENKVIVETESPDTQQPIKRRRKKKSMVWDHFTTETTASGTTKAFCNHCNKSYAYMSGGKASGTSHLKRHIELGICDKHHPKTTDLKAPQVKKRQRDQDGCSHEMAKMIIMHDYPLHMVEHHGFTSFVKALRPQFSVSSFDAVHGDCVEMFLSEKQKVSELIGEIPGGVNLTVDLWLSTQSVGYAFVTGHFVDRDWKLTRRLLNVSVVPSPDSDFALNQPLASCLSEWKLEGKVSSLTVNKDCVDNLRGFLSFRNQQVLNGQFLTGRCYARLLGGMAQEALAAEEVREAVKKVGDSVKYVKTNDACGDKFEEVRRLFPASAPYKELLIDNRGRWDTSYEMLLAGYEHRQVFSCLETCYPGYEVSISPEEWRKIESLCLCLKVLFEASEVLTRPNLTTANNFYKEMTKIQLELSRVAMGEEEELVNSLRERFDLYWRGCYLVVAVAAVMDPRFKMQYVKETFTESYGEEDAEQWIKTVTDAVRDLYHSYSDHSLIDAYVGDDGFTGTEVVVQGPHFQHDIGSEQLGDETSPQSEQTTESSHQHETQPKLEEKNVKRVWEGVGEEYQNHTSFMMDDVLLEEGSTLVTVGDSFSDFDVSEMQEMKPELDRYLDDGLVLESEDFDVLGWWRVNSNNYPTLAKMAADLLSVPFSTVSGESVFDTEVKQMDSYRTSLPRGTLEALCCTKDWLKHQTL